MKEVHDLWAVIVGTAKEGDEAVAWDRWDFMPSLHVTRYGAERRQKHLLLDGCTDPTRVARVRVTIETVE